MPRISHATPMNAYDHVAKLLKQAGGNNVISRAEAKALVAQLKKEGKGTEAMAAGNIFKLIDARDNAPGARVTGYDLDKDRSYVQQKLLENRDINRNGYARAEIAKMSPTGRALVELGQVLAMEKPRARIAYATPEKGLNHITALLKAAAKGDPITSRADVNALVRDLNKQGRGTEALAAATFFRFIDFRDRAPGARVTATDINKAQKYAAETLLRAKDHNRNGYSAAEVASFSKSAKAFLLLGQMIEAKILKSAAV
jgi:hypothetical protein